MYLIRGTHNLELFKSKYPNLRLCGTIGNFDGLHLGHQSILDKVISNSKKYDAKTIVFFTEPHAREYFSSLSKSKKDPPPRIFQWRKKVMLLKEYGIDFAFFLKFNNSLQTMSPNEFISEILASINLVSFNVGDDFKFGANRQGDIKLLREWGKKNNILIQDTETYFYQNERVSSTRIRKALLKNEFEKAEKLLGRPYIISGKVVHGQHIGRTIGIPTANIWLPKQKLPINGVFAVECNLNNQKIFGIANMGTRPTIGGSLPVLEVHLFDFDQNIYSERLDIKFLQKIRNEKKFDNLDMLKSQIQKDISIAKNILSTPNDS